jgi:hypothetical protein
MDYRFQEVLTKAKRTGRKRVLISMDLKNLTVYRNEVKGTGIANILPVPVFSFVKTSKCARCSHQIAGALPPHFPKAPSIGQNRFEEIISGIFFNYYKLLKTTKR